MRGPDEDEARLRWCFIFDVLTHRVMPSLPWRTTDYPRLAP